MSCGAPLTGRRSPVRRRRVLRPRGPLAMGASTLARLTPRITGAGLGDERSAIARSAWAAREHALRAQLRPGDLLADGGRLETRTLEQEVDHDPGISCPRRRVIHAVC